MSHVFEQLEHGFDGNEESAHLLSEKEGFIKLSTQAISNTKLARLQMPSFVAARDGFIQFSFQIADPEAPVSDFREWSSNVSVSKFPFACPTEKAHRGPPQAPQETACSAMIASVQIQRSFSSAPSIYTNICKFVYGESQAIGGPFSHPNHIILMVDRQIQNWGQ